MSLPLTLSLFFILLISNTILLSTFAQNINNTGPVLASPISKAKKELEEIASRPDLLCNIDSEYECICHQSLGDLEGKYLSCNEFIQIENLPTIQLKLKNANMSARLHTSEPFEEYFKRRIANILTRYCQNNANECIGVQQRLLKVDSNEKNNINENTLTQDQVIILAVNYLPNKITLVDLVVAKQPNIGSLNGLMLMDPVQVKFILSAQITPLSRVLGGIKIEEVKTNNLSRIVLLSPTNEEQNIPLFSKTIITQKEPMNPEEEQLKKENSGSNSTLKILLLIVATFLIICYTIATYKVCRDHHLKKKARVRAEASFVPSRSNSIRNYGTLGSQKSPITDNSNVLNTKVPAHINNKTNVFSDGSNNNKNIQYPATSPSGWSNGEEEGNITGITPHSFKRMFMCDASQLPREPTIDLESQIIEEDDEGIKRVIEHPLDFGIPILHKEDEEKKNEVEEDETQAINYFQPPNITPELIVDSESLPDYELSTAIMNDEHSMLNVIQTERPISRRGSITSPHKDTEDLETTNSREGTPAPIMEDELIPKPSVIMEEDEEPTVMLEKSKPKMIPVVSITIDDDSILEDEFDDRNDAFNKIVNARNEVDDVWTSDEDEEKDNHNNLYRIMSEEHIEEESDKSDDDETNTYYQRLQESPINSPREVSSNHIIEKHIGSNHIHPFGVVKDDIDEDLR
uniref:Recep_L_domain domain-containing protein n=1 Tax=Parastrongyloides trichosuri TaxID=131310 RepID=A0A0N4ZUL3_PARTI